jgi:SAM-dependent methyltransferase
VIYQHPLAYVLGQEGLALLRACAGGYDRQFVEARFAEMEALLAGPLRRAEGVSPQRIDTVDGYRSWSATYDAEPRNGLFDIDEPIMYEIIDQLRPGDALDAACGTGRHAHHLARLGHSVTGVDSAPDMLARARTRVPEATFRLGDLGRLPVRDRAMDLVVCSLALTHVASLVPVLAEFARVLRPGGQLVLSDVHHELVFLGSVPRQPGPDGRPGLLTGYRHLASDYLSAAMAAGFRVRRCVEPRVPDHGDDGPAPVDQPFTPDAEPGWWADWPWLPQRVVPEAAAAAAAGRPTMVIWHFELT